MGNFFVGWIIVLVSLVLAAVGTAVIRNLLAAAVALALTSVILTVALFIMGLQLAAVIELSVCAGLVTAVFATAISLTRPKEDEALAAKRWKRFLPLPFILLVLAAGILLLWPGMDIHIAGGNYADAAAQKVMWEQRSLDILGLILIILAGVLGVAVLFREKEGK